MEILQIKETSLYVKDLEVCEGFYHHKLGFKIINKVKDRHVFFRVGTSVLLCFNGKITTHESSLPSHYAKGEIHIAFEVNLREYEFWKTILIKNSIKIIQEHSWPKGLKSFYFRDPDNHLLEIVPEGLWDYS